MNPKARILDAGKATYIELDGKTMGVGIDFVEYKKEADNPAELTIHIADVESFSFLPDGEFDRVEKMVKDFEPPDENEWAAPEN